MLCPWILQRGVEIYPIKFVDKQDAINYKKKKKLHGFTPKFNLTTNVRLLVDKLCGGV